MYCECVKPNKKTQEANGQSFTVCAKSSGGCGKEINTSRVIYGKNTKITIDDKELECDNISFTTDIRSGAIDIGYINAASLSVDGCQPTTSYEECPVCGGAGFVAKLYPNGHNEIACDNCDGTGSIDA